MKISNYFASPPSLRTALVGAVLIPFITTMLFTGWYVVSSLERRTDARMQKDIELVARAIQLPLSHALERGYERTVQRALESAFNIDRVYGAYVYDNTGSTVAASSGHDASMGSSRAVRIASRGERQGEFGRLGDEQVFSYFVPLVDSGGRINGLLQVTRRGSDFDDYISDMRTQTLTVIGVAGGALILVVLFGHHWVVSRHLRAVDTGLRHIGEGDLHRRFTLRGPRELRMLAAGINQMLDAILRSRAELAEQRRREAELTDRLHQSEKMAALGQLAAGVAHELGSPLSTIDGKAQQVMRRPGLPEAAGAAVRAIRRETGRMEQIIRQLLDFGRTNPLHRQRVAADQPLQAARRQIQESSPASSVRVLIEGRKPAPPVRVDIVRLEQALGNLLRNAFQAAETTVRAGWSVTDGELCYQVEDDGPGVPVELRARLFEPFFTTKPAGSGTGLGLAVAHAAVLDHGGRLEVSESALGGARFRLYLPLNGADA